ncbi:MAG TPA: PP0621 family protein [Burkholderiales bacterium]
MGRLLSLLLLVVLAVWLVRRALRRIAARGESAPPPAQAGATEELVRCAHCSVLLPRGEARMAAGALYCGEEHARLGPRASRNA